MELWSTFSLSLWIAGCATLLVTLLAVPLAFWFARTRFLGRSLAESLLLVPLVLPPTVVGYLLVLLLGRQGLGRAAGGSLLFTITGAIIAAAVVALPLVFLPSKAAFASVDPDLEDLARLFGANSLQIFWHVSLPAARRAIASGVILAFARALGEFGATMMVLGDIEGRRTLPIAIYTSYIDGDLTHAWPAVLLLSLISLIAVLAFNRTLLTTPR
ncbi:MAG TPA: molybdate ABC transporter permease subunit [Tepidisphaeraceae bacterium]|nr:molybdate ABC transporter permease subunit [Tepidisphaeraceae bacterium]